MLKSLAMSTPAFRMLLTRGFPRHALYLRGVRRDVFCSWRGQIQSFSNAPDLGTVPANIMKGGTDPPILPDSEYPDWLWTVHEPMATLQDLVEKVEEVSWEGLNEKEQRRLMKLAHKKEMEEKKAKKSAEGF